MLVSAAFIKQLQKVEPTLRELILALLEELERQREETVSRREFDDLKKAVEVLTKNVNELTISVRELTKKVNELAEAQKRTEERVNELAEAQKRTEERVNELAEAQKRTEERVNELAEAQKRTEERVNELAEAQKRTEETVAMLVKDIKVLENRIEGVSNTVGYFLEDRAYVSLPKILKERFGVEVEGKLIRKYFILGSKEIQINIYGYGKKDNKKVLILGECKVRPSKNEINRFEKYAKKIAKKEGVEPFLLFVAYDFPPKIEEFLQQKEIPYIWSYELRLI